MAPKAESINVNLGRTIRHQRAALGISQEELAARSDLHRTYVADVERGNRNPSLVSIQAIAKGLGVPISELFHQVEQFQKTEAGDGPKGS